MQGFHSDISNLKLINLTRLNTVSLSAGEKSRSYTSPSTTVEYINSRLGNERIAMSPEVDAIARRVGSLMRLKHV